MAAAGGAGPLPPPGQPVLLRELVQGLLGLAERRSDGEGALALPALLRAPSVRVAGTLLPTPNQGEATAMIQHQRYRLRLDMRMVDCDSVQPMRTDGAAQYAFIGELYACKDAPALWASWPDPDDGLEAPWVAVAVRVVVDVAGLDMDLFEEAIAIRRKEIGV